MVGQMLEVVEEMLRDGERYGEISVGRLIRGAGISRSTFYVYFEDKGALLLSLAEGVVQELIGAAEAWWTLPPQAVEDDLADAMRGIIDVYRTHSLIWDSPVYAACYYPRVREE